MYPHHNISQNTTTTMNYGTEERTLYQEAQVTRMVTYNRNILTTITVLCRGTEQQDQEESRGYAS
jgi:hypothetical protein